jgi:DNA-binding transcriptional ArsR family regulator
MKQPHGRTLGGQVSVSQLAADYAMSFAAVQKHVAVLEAAGLIHKTPQGRQRLVRADAERIRRARAALAALEDQWRDRVSRLDDLFARQKE